MSVASDKKEIKPLLFETYLTVIKNSVGSNSFRNFYVEINGKQTDIMRNGELSCAFFVSSILALFKFIDEAHATVDSTIKDLKKSGWNEIQKPEIGSILVWEKIDFGDSDVHKHIGFYLGNDEAISNDYKLGYPVSHHWNFNNTREVNSILWNQKIKLGDSFNSAKK